MRPSPAFEASAAGRPAVGQLTGAARRMVREHRGLAVLLVVGVLLRVLYAVWFWPVNGGFLDSSAVLNQSENGIFRDPLRLPGYPFLLRIVELVWAHVFAVVLLQFVMGLLTATLLYAVVARVTASRRLALIPAGYVLLSGDHMVSEHSILGEASMVFFVALGCWGWSRASRAAHLWWWLLPGASFAIASTVRFGPVVLAVAAALTAVLIGGSPKLRLRRAGVLVLGALPIVLAWSLAQGDSTGRYLPGYSATGWSLYSRVAAIADCTKTTVDADLRFLCEPASTIRDPDVSKRRGGAGFYLYQGGPAVERFGAPTETSAPGADVLQRFAVQVIKSQPLDYANLVASDALRYFDRNIGYDRYFTGSNEDEQEIARRAIGAPEDLLRATAKAAGFTAPAYSVDDEIGRLEDWQRVFRLKGLGLLLVLALAVTAVVRAGPGRREAALLVGLGGLFLLLPALTQTTSYRHSIPAFFLLVAAAAIGLTRFLEQPERQDGSGSVRAEAGPAPVDRPHASPAR